MLILHLFVNCFCFAFRYVIGATLPDQNQEFEGTATVSGWGTLSSDGPNPDALQAVEVPIVKDKGISYRK